MNIWLNDLKCKAIQRMVYNVYKKRFKSDKKVGFRDFVNSKEPFNTEAMIEMDEGILLHNDIRYADTYDNSFLDIYYPSPEKKKWPVVVYYHGGGFIFGRKCVGDPLSVGHLTTIKKLLETCKEGYAVINADYALAPKYRFKDIFLQVDLMFRYLLDHQEELNLDMNHVALTGGSAGADITLIYGLLVDSMDYQREVGIVPCLTHDNLKVLLPDEPALQYKQFNNHMWTMLGTFLGDLTNTQPDILDVDSRIKGPFFPTWLNASNKPADPFFKQEYEAFSKVALENGIRFEGVFFDYDEEKCNLSHGYMDQIGQNEYADKAFASFLRFLKENI